MDDTSLQNLKSLWEKLDVQKVDDKKNHNKDLLGNCTLPRYNKNTSHWIPPNFAKLPTLNPDFKKSTTLFSMAYNEEEKTNNSFSKVRNNSSKCSCIYQFQL